MKKNIITAVVGIVVIIVMANVLRFQYQTTNGTQNPGAITVDNQAGKEFMISDATTTYTLPTTFSTSTVELPLRDEDDDSADGIYIAHITGLHLTKNGQYYMEFDAVNIVADAGPHKDPNDVTMHVEDKSRLIRGVAASKDAVVTTNEGARDMAYLEQLFRARDQVGIKPDWILRDSYKVDQLWDIRLVNRTVVGVSEGFTK